ncbi:hypothetical protein MHBO_004110 [Bonamia ostreae]|uniref:Uncharacterized protein n=1 Tax=Bonamia ostreae TaxID=126728 RepID=A0ABV2ASF2_9EUKA
MSDDYRYIVLPVLGIFLAAITLICISFTCKHIISEDDSDFTGRSLSLQRRRYGVFTNYLQIFRRPEDMDNNIRIHSNEIESFVTFQESGNIGNREDGQQKENVCEERSNERKSEDVLVL